MANLTVDSWALHRLTLDFADQFVPGTLIANAADSNGRGIDLYITDNGEPVSLTGMSVYLMWHHSGGNQGQTQFTAVDAANGHFKVYYPAGMMYEGIVTARISIYIGTNTPITGSRDFRINVERNPIDVDQAMASDEYSALVQATIDAADAARNAITAAAMASTAAENANAAAAATANVVADAVAALANETGSEAAQIKVMAIQLVELTGDYMVLGETLYTPTAKNSSVSSEAVTRTSASVSGEIVTLS